MSELFWLVESLIVKDNTLFGFGWIFHAQQKIVALRFRLMNAEGVTIGHISANIGKHREDVGHAYLDQPRALNSGYVIFGTFPAAACLDSIRLECSLTDGSVVELAVPPSRVIRFSNENEANKNHLMLRQFSIFFKRGLHLIRARKFTSLFEKVRRYLKGRPRAALQKPSDLAALLRQHESNNLCLILDHDLGGGANHYRDRLVDSIIREGRSVIILTYHVATLSHMLIVRNNRINLRCSIPDKSFLLDAVRNLSVSDIIYNTAVSFVRPEEIPQLLISLKELTSARLKVLAHDFYLVCPSHFLLDHEGKYCNIPDTSVCAHCLPKNRQGFTTLFIERDMPKWRAIWGSLLASADEIVTFSNSTAQLLMKAYPQIEGSRISITPHNVEHLTGEFARIKETGRLCIGIVGHIGFHKGAAFIQALAREIKRREVDLKIVVIGSIEASCAPSVVSQTGSYRHEELLSLVEASGANIMLFPSIWPETFSYVVQELMDMKLPVASFNFGAPAERLSSYPKGLVLTSMNPATVLDELISFHRKIYLAH